VDHCHPQVARAPQHLHGDVGVVTTDLQLDYSLAQAQSRQSQLIEEIWQHRTLQANLAVAMVKRETERGLKKSEGGRRSPCLRRAGNGIERWPDTGLPRKTAEQLGQAMQIHII